MMIDEYSIIRDFGFSAMDPYSASRDRHFPATGFSNSPSRRNREREFIIPIQIEGREPVTPVHHIDLTTDHQGFDNSNNNGLHSQARNRRRNQITGHHSRQDVKHHSDVSTFSLTNRTGSQGRSNQERDIPVRNSQSSSSVISQETQDIIDLCMFEDMLNSEVYVTEHAENCKDVANSDGKSKTVSKDVEMDTQDETEPSKTTTPTPSYPVYKYLKSQLARDGRLIDYIRGDGNCFFRALSKDIYGAEDFHEDVRQAVVDLIEKYSKSFEQFLDTGVAIHDHIKEMRKTSTWASSAEIYAAATLVQRDIYVLSPDHTGDSYHWMLFKPRFIYTRDTSYHPCFITLCHTHGNHYDRITPQRGECNCDKDPPALSGVHAYVDLTS